MAEQLPDWERLLAAAARLRASCPTRRSLAGTAAAITADVASCADDGDGALHSGCLPASR